MEFGAHLPIVGFDGRSWSLERLRAYATSAERLGFRFLCVNDHLVFSRPWLDCLTALAVVLDSSGSMRLVTSVALPVVRGPVALAKSLAALDVLSGGRLGLGPGAGWSPPDYAPRGGAAPAARGKFPPGGGGTQAPPPPEKRAPPLWIGSWGSEAGLRRAARY